jgi:hypothetical protein
MTLLTVGTRVHCILYGGKDGVVYAIHGEQRPDTIQSIANVIATGGNASFDIVWENGTESLLIPESILRGVQWETLPGIADAEEIKSMREYAAQEKERRERATQEELARFTEEAQSLRGNAEYAYLRQGTMDDQFSGNLAAKNIRAELKRVFPGTTFSVRKRHYGSVCISWLNGPTTKAVEAVTEKYESGSFNSSEDIYVNAICPWNAVFGGSKYISCSRSYSVDVLQAAVNAVGVRHRIGPVVVAHCGPGEGYLAGDHSDQRIVYEYLEKTGRFREQSEPSISDVVATTTNSPDPCD